MTRRVALYARYSSDQQSDASIEDQLRSCRVRAEREGWIVVGEHSDKAISGAVRLRQGLDALLSEVERSRVDIVLTESLDRLSRDLEHVASLYKRITFHGAEIITLSEGVVTDIDVGLRGTMASLYLKDLAAKTHRGLEGRIRQGRAIGKPPYGYRVVHRFGQGGEPERGLRSIDEAEAVIVRRIFDTYARGTSPLQIARQLNAEGILGPTSGPWLEDSIRGREGRRDGILRNPIYDGRLIWNRRHNLKNPITGALVRRANRADAHVEVAAEHLRIVDHELWEATQARLRANAAAPNPAAPSDDCPGFWDRRRPRHLLSRKVFCGTCGNPFATMGKDYLRCMHARNGRCGNTVSLRRPHLERLVLRVMGERLMAPAILSSFIEALREEHAKLVAGANAASTATSRTKAMLERRIANLVDALADGDRSPSLRSKLAELETQMEQLNQAQEPKTLNIAPVPADPASLYRSGIAEIEAALADDTSADLREHARAYIRRLEVHPPREEGEPPNIIVEGNLPQMLQLAGIGAMRRTDAAASAHLEQVVECSVKRDPGAKPLAFLHP